MKISLTIVAAVAVVAAAVILAAMVAAAVPTVLGSIALRRGIPHMLQQNRVEQCWNITPVRARVRGIKGFAGQGLVEVSSEYADAVTKILESDPDAAKLLQEGYNVTWIRPIIKAFVSATGDVTFRATQALVHLKGPSGAAQVLVDVSQGKVLKIVIVTRTVITKS